MKLKRLICIMAIFSILVCYLSATVFFAHAAPGNMSISTAIAFPGTAGDENKATGITAGQSLFYKVSLSANQWVYFALYSLKDYDLYLWGPSQTQLRASTKSVLFPDYIEYVVPSNGAGTYYVELRAYAGSGITASSVCNFKYIISCGTTSNTNTAYSRSLAQTYAVSYWDAYNSSYPKYPADCANFVSQCLKWAGMTYTGSDYTSNNSWFCNTTSNADSPLCAYTWRAANNFTAHWGTNSAGTGYKRAYECKYLIGNDISSNFSTFISKIKLGDVIQLTNSGSSNRFHTLIVCDITSTDVIMACHSPPNKTRSLKTRWMQTLT